MVQQQDIDRWVRSAGLQVESPVTESGDRWTVNLADANQSLGEVEHVPGGVGIVLRLPKGRTLVLSDAPPPGLTFVLGEGHLEVGGGVTVVALDVRGPGNVVLENSQLVEPTFGGEGGQGRLRLVLGRQSTVSGARGSVSVQAKTAGVHCGGDETVGLRVRALTFDQNVEGAELINVDLFEYLYVQLGNLAATNRLQPWWPVKSSGRADLNSMRSSAADLDVPATAQRDKARQRARFWGEVADTMRKQGIGGRGQALAMWLAAEMRRLASTFWGDRAILQVSRLFGHGSLIFRPLLVWIATAFVTALAIGALFGDYVPKGASFMGLWIDTLLAPFSFLRSVAQPDLDPVVNDGPWTARLLAFLPRVIGAAAIVFAAVALRRRSRFSSE